MKGKVTFKCIFWKSSLWSSAKLQNILSFWAFFLVKTLTSEARRKFLCVVRIRFEYVKHSSRSGEYSAFWFMTVRPTKHFLLKEKWLSSEFFEIQVSEALPNLPLCASFWWRLWLQKPVENFLCVVRIRSEYVKQSPRSGEYSALWFMTVRPTKHFLFDKVLTPLYPAVWTTLLYLIDFHGTWSISNFTCMLVFMASSEFYVELARFWKSRFWSYKWRFYLKSIWVMLCGLNEPYLSLDAWKMPKPGLLKPHRFSWDLNISSLTW